MQRSLQDIGNNISKEDRDCQLLFEYVGFSIVMPLRSIKNGNFTRKVFQGASPRKLVL